jgi:hypothetical protein
MAISNSGNNVLVDTGGVNLAGFTNAAASNIKIQDATVYTITSGAVGSNANGSLLLTKASGSVATLDSNHTFLFVGAGVNGGSSSDSPVSNMALSAKGAKLVIAGTSFSGAEVVAPLIGDAQTQVVYRLGGTLWNSIHPAVNIVGSTFILQSTGDGHLGRNPTATVLNPSMIWTGTSPNAFVLAINQGWGADNKPSAIDGFNFQSIVGNNLVSMFTWLNPTLPGNFQNNAFFVCKDWTYNVASVGTRPTALLRSYRRSDFTATASSYWGSGSICPTHLHIDLKTTLSAAGVLGAAPTYLRTINYNAVGTGGSDKAVDVLALRFRPTMSDPVGTKLANVSVVVQNTNANCSTANAIGAFRARLAASGVTDSTGLMVITEPVTKNYTSNASYQTDSIIVQNRTRTAAWHKWWEAGTKLINIADSRNGLGTTAPELYAATDFQVSYRRAGSQFSSGALSMDAPQIATVVLSSDTNYNGALSTSGITVTYATGTTTVTLTNATFTLDQVWKAIVDFHATAANNEAETVFPITSFAAGVLTSGSALSIVPSALSVITKGALIDTFVGNLVNVGTIANLFVTGNVTQATPINLTDVTITGNLTFNTNTPVTVTFTNSSVSGTVSNSGTGLVTVQLATSTIGTVGTNVTTQIVTALNLTGLLADSQIYLSDGTNTQVDYVSSSGTSYTYNSTGGTGTWTWRLRKYGYQDQTGTFTPATNSATVAALYLVDSFVSDTLVNVTAYTDLETTQKIYDYSRYFATTNTGIALGPQFTKGFGTLTANSAFTLDPLAVAMMAVSSGVTTHTTGLNETATVVVTGNFTQGTATLSNNIKIRATNLDSELLFSGIDSLTIYATQADALTNTSPGASSSTGIIRFLYGASLSGVTMSGTVYLRIVLGTAIQVQSLTLVLGENEVNLSTTTLLQAIPSEVLNATVEANVSLAESLRLANSVLGGKVSGAGTATETFRDINDTKNRVVADVDNNGNRTAITLDLS